MLQPDVDLCGASRLSLLLIIVHKIVHVSLFIRFVVCILYPATGGGFRTYFLGRRFWSVVTMARGRGGTPSKRVFIFQCKMVSY